MGTAVNLWPLIGVVVIIAGFILRFNPMLVVAVAGWISRPKSAEQPHIFLLTAATSARYHLIIDTTISIIYKLNKIDKLK